MLANLLGIDVRISTSLSHPLGKPTNQENPPAMHFDAFTLVSLRVGAFGVEANDSFRHQFTLPPTVGPHPCRF